MVADVMVMVRRSWARMMVIRPVASAIVTRSGGRVMVSRCVARIRVRKRESERVRSTVTEVIMWQECEGRRCVCV